MRERKKKRVRERWKKVVTLREGEKEKLKERVCKKDRERDSDAKRV